MNEPRASRVRRRAVTVPTMLGATALALVGAPLAVPLLAAADLARGRFRLPRPRIYLFGLQYLVNDSIEIVLAPLYWVLAGAGTRLGTPASVERHRRLQWWSLDLLARRAERLLGLRVEPEDGVAEAFRPGPVVVIGRHVSPFDASLAGLILGRQGVAVRGVVMAELLADPGFDLLYGRLGSVFVPRDDGPAAREAIRSMATALRRHDGAEAAVVIFPEGRLFRPSARDRALARLADADPVRAERLAGLAGVLPPRPGGLRILLEELPEADVVVLDHVGLDGLRSLGDLVGAVPVEPPVRVTARRVPRHEIPGLEPGADPDRFTAWLDGIWLELDPARAAERRPDQVTATDP